MASSRTVGDGAARVPPLAPNRIRAEVARGPAPCPLRPKVVTKVAKPPYTQKPDHLRRRGHLRAAPKAVIPSKMARFPDRLEGLATFLKNPMDRGI